MRTGYNSELADLADIYDEKLGSLESILEHQLTHLVSQMKVFIECYDEIEILKTKLDLVNDKMDLEDCEEGDDV